MDSSAKVISAVRRALEIHTGNAIDNEVSAATLDVIMDEDVLPFEGVSPTIETKCSVH